VNGSRKSECGSRKEKRMDARRTARAEGDLKWEVGMRKWEFGSRDADPSPSDKAGLPSSPSATPRQDAAAKDAAFDKLPSTCSGPELVERPTRQSGK
jgi:hypothetical protein